MVLLDRGKALDFTKWKTFLRLKMSMFFYFVCDGCSYNHYIFWLYEFIYTVSISIFSSGMYACRDFDSIAHNLAFVVKNIKIYEDRYILSDRNNSAILT